MTRLYKTLPWGIIMLGALHMAATFKIHDALTPAALWFFNGGIVLVLTGVLNVVNHQYGAAALGLRWFCTPMLSFLHSRSCPVSSAARASRV